MNKVKEALETIQDHLCHSETKGKHIVVLDRGWIFVGNLTKLEDDGYMLTECQNIRKWSTGGFGGLTKSKVASGATCDDCKPIKFHSQSVVFYSPVSGDWS